MRENTRGLVHRRGTLAALIMAVIMGTSTPAWSVVLSHPTGQINGRAPAAAGAISILMPDGTTTLVDNAQVWGSFTPNEFTLAPLSPGVAFTDADGDTQATPGLAIVLPGVTWTWLGPGGAPLTSAQLSQSFATNFAHDDTLTVQANAPVLSTSLTGLPTTSGTPIAFVTPAYRVRVNNPPPVLNVDGVNFAWDSGFPTIGFVGAKFQLFMNSIDATMNSHYTYSVDQSWASAGTDGTIIFTGTPTSATKSLRIIATNNSDSSDTHTLDITLGRWFVNNGNTKMTAANTDAYCAGLGGGYSTPPYATMTNAPGVGTSGTRAATDGLQSQWGNMGSYGSGWVIGNFYWAPELAGSNRQVVFLDSGYLSAAAPSSGWYAACSRTF